MARNKQLAFDVSAGTDDRDLPHEYAPGEMADGTICVWTPEQARERAKLWRAQQEALDRGEDPTLLEETADDEDFDVSDLDDYDDL